MLADAYVNAGRWVADCPRPHCSNALALEAGQPQFYCDSLDGCLLLAQVRWPDDADAIWAALAERPVVHTRNWAPAGHRQAVLCGFPDGQSVADLRAETAEHMSTGVA